MKEEEVKRLTKNAKAKAYKLFNSCDADTITLMNELYNKEAFVFDCGDTVKRETFKYLIKVFKKHGFNPFWEHTEEEVKKFMFDFFDYFNDTEEEKKHFIYSYLTEAETKEIEEVNEALLNELKMYDSSVLKELYEDFKNGQKMQVIKNTTKLDYLKKIFLSNEDFIYNNLKVKARKNHFYITEYIFRTFESLSENDLIILLEGLFYNDISIYQLNDNNLLIVYL